MTIDDFLRTGRINDNKEEYNSRILRLNKILEDHFKDNEEKFYEKNPGKYFIFELDKDEKVIENFYDDEEKFNKAYQKYIRTPWMRMNLNFKRGKIPSKSHKYENIKTTTSSCAQAKLVDGEMIVDESTRTYHTKRITYEDRSFEYVKYCIHSDETELVPTGRIEANVKNNYFSQIAECLDCGYKVNRRLSDEEIESYKKRHEEFIKNDKRMFRKELVKN